MLPRPLTPDTPATTGPRAGNADAAGLPMASPSSGNPLAVDELPLTRIRELLEQARPHLADGAAWELGIHVETLAEALKESAARLSGVEAENRHLQERLGREHQEYLALRASMDELLNLSELAETISSSFDVGDIIESLMDLSSRFVAYESCGVFLLDAEAQGLQTVGLRGQERLVEQVRAQWDDGIIDWVLREGRPVVIEDMETLDQPGVAEASFVTIPLRVRGKQLGIYSLRCRRAKDDFTAGEIDLLGVLANQTAVAIENSRLYTDLESAHHQLQDSQRQILLATKLAAIGELAGGVAHEVNNPLQIILSRVQLLLLQPAGPERVRDGLRLIESNVKRISRIIRALLGFAGHNVRDEDWVPFDLAQSLQQAHALVAHQLEQRLIRTRIECEEGLPRLVGNLGELEQVFINLILNALNAMPRGGDLRITARRIGEGVEIRFADTGVGIAREHLDRIFEPFFTTRSAEGGTGLGLAVSYGIVEAHQGTITVESEPGQGAVFIIRLPLASRRM
ncbi:MAG: ATP-binding protein [Candidatus Latescibacterota bacterium]|jgi:signal transduction histidine kinase